MAYDEARNETVLFAGQGSHATRDVWVWDGSQWTERKPTIVPTPQYGHAMAYDAARKRVVLFGGMAQTKVLAETWEWDGTAWTLMKPKTSPSARLHHRMVYDSLRKRVLLFGGSIGGGATAYNETWSWDGKTWSLEKPLVSPPARYSAGMAYDRKHDRVVLFGGYWSASGSNDTWTYDGKTWAQQSYSTQPRHGATQSVAYDARAEQVVLYGGHLFFALYHRELWRWGDHFVASATPYGKGCGPAQGLQLKSAMGYDPTLGSRYVMNVAGLPWTTSSGLIAIGASRSRLGPVPLPLDLGPFGMKSCNLYQSFELSWSFVSRVGAGFPEFVVPHRYELRGTKAYAQVLGLSPGATKAGLIASNGLEITFGYQ